MKKILNPVVIKLGGSSLAGSQTLVELASFIRKLKAQAYDVVIVHGGGPAINEELNKQGIQWSFINGQRKTSPEMIDIINDVLAKKVNSQIVTSLNDAGIGASGLSGAKDKILFCSQADPALGLVGEIMNVDLVKVNRVLGSTENTVPVIAPVGFGVNGELYNINADWAAAKIAVALEAKQLVFLTDQKGILDGNKNPVVKACAQDLMTLIETGVVSGGMCTKVLAMVFALEKGVGQVRVTHAHNASTRVGSVLTPVENGRKEKRRLVPQMETKGRLYGQPG